MDQLKKIFHNKTLKQTGILFFSTIFLMFISLTTNFYITKYIDKKAFGEYSFIINLFTFLQIIFNFGFFYVIGRLVALTNDEIEMRNLYGIGIIIGFALSVILSLTFFLFLKINCFYSLNNQIKQYILLCLPFSWIFIFINYNEQVLQGSNKVTLLAFSRLAPKLIFLFFILYLHYVVRNSTETIYILLFYFFSYIISTVFIFYILKPSFLFKIDSFLKVFSFTKEFGFNIYLGSILAVGASSLSGVLIGYFGKDNSDVGVFNLAQQFSIPISIIPNILATVFFKKFVTDSKLDRNLLLIIYMISFITLVIIFIISKPLVMFFYGDKFFDSILILRLLSISAVFYGISDFYTKFLLSKGRGKEIRNSSFIVGIVLFISNLIFIYYYSALGAAIASIIAGFVYFIVIVYFFNKELNK